MLWSLKRIIYLQRNSMHTCTKFFLLAIVIAFCTSVGIAVADPLQLAEEVTIDNLFEENDDLLLIDINELRSFDAMTEEADIPFKDKMSMFFIIFRSKTSDYRDELFSHLKEYSNEYLLGTACIAGMLFAALLKSYINQPAKKAHAK